MNTNIEERSSRGQGCQGNTDSNLELHLEMTILGTLFEVALDCNLSRGDREYTN